MCIFHVTNNRTKTYPSFIKKKESYVPTGVNPGPYLVGWLQNATKCTQIVNASLLFYDQDKFSGIYWYVESIPYRAAW